MLSTVAIVLSWVVLLTPLLDILGKEAAPNPRVGPHDVFPFSFAIVPEFAGVDSTGWASMATTLNLLSGHRADGCRQNPRPDHGCVQEHFMNKAVAFAED
eukprot:1629807-Amphidinium_carterae.1